MRINTDELEQVINRLEQQNIEFLKKRPNYYISNQEFYNKHFSSHQCRDNCLCKFEDNCE